MDKALVSGEKQAGKMSGLLYAFSVLVIFLYLAAFYPPFKNSKLITLYKAFMGGSL